MGSSVGSLRSKSTTDRAYPLRPLLKPPLAHLHGPQHRQSASSFHVLPRCSGAHALCCQGSASLWRTTAGFRTWPAPVVALKGTALGPRSKEPAVSGSADPSKRLVTGMAPATCPPPGKTFTRQTQKHGSGLLTDVDLCVVWVNRLHQAGMQHMWIQRMPTPLVETHNGLACCTAAEIESHSTCACMRVMHDVSGYVVGYKTALSPPRSECYLPRHLKCQNTNPSPAPQHASILKAPTAARAGSTESCTREGCGELPGTNHPMQRHSLRFHLPPPPFRGLGGPSSTSWHHTLAV